MFMELRKLTAPGGALMLMFASAAVARSHEANMTMDSSHSQHVPVISSSNATEPQTYFQYGEHSALLMAHIVLMVIGWVFVLPIGVMLSISRSRFRYPIEILFLFVNGAGAVLATVYNARTPDLYPNNAHHKLGWLLTWFMGAHLIIGILHAYVRQGRQNFTPISTKAISAHQRLPLMRQETYRFSNDSGHGTDPNTASLRSNSSASFDSIDNHAGPSFEHEKEDEDERHTSLRCDAVNDYLSSIIPRCFSSSIFRGIWFFYNAVDRFILVLGFVAIASGIVTYGGFFMGSRVFSGLAHFIKGGVFFWYGILTLGRWAGCFADIGWAWNVNPSHKTRLSAEFVESFLIFIYGSTNVFLEHLAAWGHEWTAQDLEHISLTLMFFGGGVCGMVIESKRIRALLNVRKQSEVSHLRYCEEEAITTEASKCDEFSINPIPALVILLLGKMMSSHHQESIVSTMIHTQWGTLLMGAALARVTTYILCYLSPPTSTLPGRPPTELITGFCLMTGGIIFMASARDTVMAIENNHLDAMLIFTVSVGVITFLMAWILLVISIKGWAVKKENQESAYRVTA